MTTQVALPIRLLLIDDHALFREGVTRLLAGEPDLDVRATCKGVKEAIAFLDSSEVDVVLLDFDLGTERALDFVEEVKRRELKCRILVVKAGVDHRGALELIQAGVAGIFHKHNPPDTFSRSIHQVARGEVWLEEHYLKPLFRLAQPQQREARAVLTGRERSVLRSLFEGLANKEIAEQLKVSEGAVKGTLQQLFQKTGVRTRSQLVRLALDEYRDQL